MLLPKYFFSSIIFFFSFEKLSHIILVKNIRKNSIEYRLKTQLLNNLATEIGARKLILSKVKTEKFHNSDRTSVAECTIPIFSFSFYFRFYILCVYYFSSTCNYLIKCYNNLVWVKLYVGAIFASRPSVALVIFFGLESHIGKTPFLLLPYKAWANEVRVPLVWLILAPSVGRTSAYKGCNSYGGFRTTPD